ncbi:D-alanine--D-alanine ligase [Microbispora bryophytorum subsp. camponoti]
MSDLGHVLILAGGLSYEREVSIRSGRRVAEVLRAAGVDVETRDADSTLVPAVLADPPDAVFVTLHGGAGEDGAIRSVLELLDVPYVGATPDACRVAFDKPTAKAVVRSWGLNTPDSVALPKETFHDLGAAAVLARIIDRLGLPLFVKPSRGGSALGASMVRTAEELPAAMVGCFAYGDTALIERYVEGVEVSVSVVDLGDGPVALPPVEIVPDRGVYDYAARYTAGHTEFFAPARLSPRPPRRVRAWRSPPTPRSACETSPAPTSSSMPPASRISSK